MFQFTYFCFLFKNKDKIIRRINTNLVKKANRSPKIIYYDVTNFYFEIENPDEDILIEEKVVVYWSKKFQERDEKENKSFLDFIKKLQDTPENFRLIALQNKSIRKFLKKEYINKSTGETLNSSEIKPMLDFEKINAYTKSLGYYQIVTSELNMAETEVIDKYHGLTQIEEQFRTMKSTLETRPLYVRTPEHIEAHLLICLISLIILRIIQKRIIASNQIPISEDMYWTTGINGNRIQDALNKWLVDLMPNQLYRFMNIEDHDLQIILKAFEITIPKKLFTLGELKNLKTNIKVFIQVYKCRYIKFKILKV